MSTTQYIVNTTYILHVAYSNEFLLMLRGNKIMEHKIKFRITEVLQQRGQSLYWLARNTGISYTTLWRLTKERALGINFATLEKVCVALECPPGDLMEMGIEKTQRPKRRPAPARAARRTSSLL